MNLKRILFITLIFSLLSKASIHAQTNQKPIGSHFCNTDELHKEKFKNDPLYRAKSIQLTNQGVLNAKKSSGSKTAAVQYTIPIVVHIIHNNGTENISDQQVIDGINHLNQAFANQGSYRGTHSVEVGIQFCLAKQDANGNFSSGINRVVSPLTDVNKNTQDQQLKNLIRWDPKKYLNIWLVKEICSGPSDCDVAGYAYLAPAHGEIYDGVVNEARWFGSSEDNSKVHIHEVGHYLNLLHTFNDGCTNNNCLLDGDQVCDTPPDQSTAPVYPCGSFTNTCHTDSDDNSSNNPFRATSLGGKGDQNDMIENYMDYGYQACQNTFTEGQRDRMIAALTGIRSSLLSSKGCESPCSIAITAAFVPSITTTINPGTSISFTNNSTGATSYEWKINGTTFSNAFQPTYTFNDLGLIKVTLITRNSDLSCIGEYSHTIEVACFAKASFTMSSDKINPGGSVTFTNTSTNATSYKWILDGTQIATSQNLTHTFPLQGGYTIYLIASTNTCSDTSKSRFVKAGSCDINNNKTLYFGARSGISFKNGPPVPLNNSYMLANEGCSGICDANGDIIFYSNGDSVITKNHTVMPNGKGLFGSYSSTQACLITPHPGDPTKYYIFTTDAVENNGNLGLRYSIVDMTLNGGLGDVVSKNNLLFAPCGEKLAAGYHSNNTDLWVMSQKTNGSFVSYLISSTGLNTTPVTSPPSPNAFGELGGMKLSNNGKKLAVNCVHFGDRFTELYDFNNTTGKITFNLTLSSWSVEQPYDLEFSENDSKLYVTSVQGDPLTQFDLNAGSPTDIINSKTAIETLPWMACGGIVLGPDNKIYINTGQAYLAVINNPDASGTACNYTHNGLTLPPLSNATTWTIGMPNIVRNTVQINITGPDTICAQTKKVVFKLNNPINNPNTSWLLDGGGNIKSSAKDSVVVNFANAGIDTLSVLVDYNGCPLSNSIAVHILPAPIVNLGHDTIYCFATISRLLTAGTNSNTYLWQDNSTNTNYTVTQAGTYWVKATDGYGCSSIDSIIIKQKTMTPVDISDAVVCAGEIHTFDAGEWDEYKWMDGTDTRKYTAYSSGKYWVTVTDHICGSSSDTAYLQMKPLPLVSFTGLHPSNCISDTPYELTGYPAGGMYSGGAMDGILFSPMNAGEGVHTIKYSYTAPNGCVGVNNQLVVVKDTCQKDFMIPNLITPNNDSKNDQFEIKDLPKGYTLEIYNRWGKEVYKNTSYDNTWKGDNISDGVYYYVLYKEEKTFKGWVEIVR